MIGFTELQSMDAAAVKAALQERNADLDATMADLEKLPFSGGTPGQERKAIELTEQMQDQQHDVEALRQRLLELDPPAPAFQVFS